MQQTTWSVVEKKLLLSAAPNGVPVACVQSPVVSLNHRITAVLKDILHALTMVNVDSNNVAFHVIGPNKHYHTLSQSMAQAYEQGIENIQPNSA